MILCSFLWRLRITRLESHSSKQMMVYEQITFFIKNRNFSKFVFDLRIDFLIKKNGLKPGKTWVGGATLPRIPTIYVEGHTA